MEEVEAAILSWKMDICSTDCYIFYIFIVKKWNLLHKKSMHAMFYKEKGTVLCISLATDCWEARFENVFQVSCWKFNVRFQRVVYLKNLQTIDIFKLRFLTIYEW